MSVDRVMNEYFLWFRRILSLNILCWCPLVWLPGPLGIFGVASVSYFPVMILYKFIMSPLILRYAYVGRPSLVSLSLYTETWDKFGDPSLHIFDTGYMFFLRNGAQVWLAY